MLIYILEYTTTFNTVDVIDAYTSLIWTRRYCKCGDFELCIPATSKYISLLKIGQFLRLDKRNDLMIIEKIEIKTDVENGNFIIVTGRSAESLLQRRIVWNKTMKTGTADVIASYIVDKNCIDTTSNRKFNFLNISEPVGIGSNTGQSYYGENVYDAVVDLCNTINCGFKFTYSDDSKVYFKIYQGNDYSYNQSINPYVVFSSDFDNLISSDYAIDKTNFANAYEISGENSNKEAVSATVNIGDDVTGTNRYEYFISAGSINSNTESEIYYALTQKGKEKASEMKITETFESVIADTGQFVLGEDYNLGDIVQTANEYEISCAVRITEIIESWDNVNGYSINPKLETI